MSNAGDAPLRLIPGGTSCNCTTSDFEDKEIPPGGSEKITITWKPAERVGLYQQTVKVLTNDPARQEVTLTVVGKITASTQFHPVELVFSRVTANEPAVAEARLLCYLDKEFEILDHQWSDKTTADNFEMALKPLAVEQLKQWPTAVSGYLASITVKPGLPQGPFRQKLTVTTNLAEAPKMELPIEGIVGSEISIAGAGWDADRGTLNVGAVSSNQGFKRQLLLIVRGPHRHEVTFKPIEVFPNSVRATLGPRRIRWADATHRFDLRLDRDKLDDLGILAYPLGYYTRKLPGLGDIDWGRFFSVLSDTGYDGPVCIESEDRAYEGSLERRKAALVQGGRYLRQYVI